MEGPLTPQQLFDQAEVAFDAQNYKDAAALYGQAANGGHLGALNTLGYMLEDGMEGVKKNQSRAFYLYSQAASKGLGVARYNKGRCLEHGIGAAQNITAAIELYNKAAAQNDPNAKFALAFMKYIGGNDAGLEHIDIKQYFQEAWNLEDKAMRKVLISNREFPATLEKEDVPLSTIIFYWLVYRDESGMFVELITHKPDLLGQHCPNVLKKSLRKDHERSELQFYSKVLLEEDLDFKQCPNTSFEAALIRLTIACAQLHADALNNLAEAQSYLGLIKLLKPYFADNCFNFHAADIFKELTQVFLQHNNDAMHEDCLKLMQSLVDARSDVMGNARTTLEILQGIGKPKASAPATTATLCCYHCAPTGTATAQPAPGKDDEYNRKLRA